MTGERSPLPTITASEFTPPHKEPITGDFEVVRTSNHSLEVRGNVGTASALYLGALKITGEVRNAHASNHGSIIILNPQGEVIGQIEAFDSGSVICKSGVNRIKATEHGSVIIEGPATSVFARDSGHVYVIGDVESVEAHDHGTVYVVGSIKRARASSNGGIHASGEIGEVINSEDLYNRGYIKASDAMPDNIRNWVQRSLERIT